MQPYLAVVTPLANNGTLIQPVNTAAHPEHPIAPGGKPPGIWGGGNEPFPTPPIHMPPGGGNGGPPSIWPGVPTHPIVIPPEPPAGETPPTGPLGKVEWHSVWTEEYGWAVIGVQTDPHPAPSAR